MTGQTAHRSFLLLLAVGAVTALLVYNLHQPSRLPGSHLLWRLELLCYDWRLPSSEIFVDDIVLVAIDKESSDSIQAWPWPRSLHAAILDRLTAAGARAIGVDIVFSTVSGTELPENWLEEPPPSDDDLALVRALEQSGRAVLAAVLHEYEAERGEMVSEILSAQFPYWQFEEAAAAVGIVNFSKDIDGVVRRMHLKHDFQDEIEYSFALSVLQVARGIEPGTASGLSPPRHAYLPDNTVPITYAGPAQTFQTIPFYQALDPELVPDETFHDKIVLIGATDALLQDIHLSPKEGTMGKDMPGVEIQANSLATLLDGRFIRPAPLWQTLLLTLLCGLLGAAGTGLLRPVRALWSTVIPAIVLVTAVPAVLMQTHMLWVPMVSPLMALILSYAVVTVLMYVAEERERRAIRAAWQRRVAPEILDVILKNPTLAHMEGRRTTATILFSDIRNFTGMCDTMQPEQVVDLLNCYLTEMTKVIRRRRGTIHKFIGDGIMAVFGDPLPDPRHADEAVCTALEMHSRLQEMKRESDDECLKRVQIGVGIHTGELVAGDIGSEQFMEYTVIGAAVNVASRLEGLNKEMQTGIIISEATRALLDGEYELADLGMQEIRGVSEPLHVYAVRNDTSPAGCNQTPGERSSAS